MAELKEDDVLLRLVSDVKIVELCSSIIAKLELVTMDHTRRGVFRTRWASDLFKSAVGRLSGDLIDFDIDVWYAGIPKMIRQHSLIPGSMYNEIETNWLAPLLQMESKYTGFINILHNIMDMEEKAHNKLMEQSKKEERYDFTGIGFRNRVLGVQQLAALPGCVPRKTIQNQQ